jgi:hypothetical protein
MTDKRTRINLSTKLKGGMGFTATEARAAFALFAG